MKSFLYLLWILTLAGYVGGLCGPLIDSIPWHLFFCICFWAVYFICEPAFLDPYKDGTKPKHWHEYIFGDIFVKEEDVPPLHVRQLRNAKEKIVSAVLRTNDAMLEFGSRIRRAADRLSEIRFEMAPHTFHENPMCDGLCLCGLPKEDERHTFTDTHENLEDKQ